MQWSLHANVCWIVTVLHLLVILPSPLKKRKNEKTCHSLLYVSLLSKSVFSRSKTCEKIPCKEKNNWKSSLCYDQTLLFKPYIFNSLSFIFISIHVCLKKNAVFKLNLSMKFTEYLFKDLSELFMYVTCISIWIWILNAILMQTINII